MADSAPKRTLESLRAALHAHVEWPSVYTFKFIVPKAHANHLLALLGELKYTLRESATGKYVSVTAEAVLTSPDEVIGVYERTQVVKGLMSF